MEGGGLISHVLDTCALLDLATGRWTSTSAKEAVRTAVAPVLLSVSVWEISRKLRLGKLRLPCELGDVLRLITEICDYHRIGIAPVTASICHAAEMLPPHHEDPFDRMILAMAERHAVPVFTTDRRFQAYPVQVIRQW